MIGAWLTVARQRLTVVAAHWRVGAVLLFAGGAHALANALADARALLPPPPPGYTVENVPGIIADVIADGDLGADWELQRLRLSLLWHSCAWIAHTTVLHFVHVGPGFRRVGLGTLVVEILTFVPIGWLAADLAGGLDGGSLPRTSGSEFWTPDPVSQGIAIVAAAVFAGATSSRLQGHGVPIGLFAGLRSAFLFGMVCSAVVPFNIIFKEAAWPIPLAWAAYLVAFAAPVVASARDAR